MQRLSKPVQENRPVVIRFLFHNRYYLRLRRLYRSQNLLDRSRPSQQPVQIEHRVHRYRLHCRRSNLKSCRIQIR
ncbi:hypothetical protein IC575_021877 [Cucumis melo]